MSRHLPVSNPQNRFDRVALSYDEGEAPNAELEVYEDQSRSILATNDSPDVGFRWSVNPYRGCQHACAYCLSGDTRILMIDGTTKELRHLRMGDLIYGTAREPDGRRRLVRTKVVAHWQTVKRAIRITLADGKTIVASPEHRFLAQRGWQHVRDLAVGDAFFGTTRTVVKRPSIRPALRYARDGSLALAEDVHPRQCNETFFAPAERYEIRKIEDLGFELLMFDITTGTGDFIANGVVSHNCYARPTHEYLSLGAGTDFSRKIVVKRRAPELLREAFDKGSWKGELVVFSGITDCYQPLENKLGITRGCLEVCAEYRNPVGVITKSPVIERDIDVLQELGRKASAHVSVSVPFWDPAVAKALEPTVTTPERRMKIVETLAKAGIRVGVSVSPIVPGLNDEHLGDVLERARDAGASHAFYVLLRLPGAVKATFEEAMQKHLPLRAEKVQRRLMEAHGGKVYDSSFGTRGRGNSAYTETIRLLFERTAKRCGLVSDELTSYAAPGAVGSLAPGRGEPTFRRPSKNGQTSFDF
ncbi:MAG: radical SAM protein [Labilithrix sp.]